MKRADWMRAQELNAVSAIKDASRPRSETFCEIDYQKRILFYRDKNRRIPVEI